MRTSVAVGLLLVLALSPLQARSSEAEAEAEARKVVTATTARVVRILQDDGLSLAEKQARLEKIAEERFDFSLISRLVLARSWRKLSPEQRTQFEAEFKRHLSLTYGRRLGEYQGETIEVVSTRSERNGDVTVMSTLRGGANHGTSINYRMREVDGQWRVLDMIVENISMLSNFRSQIQEIVGSKGAARLIEILREKNDKEAAARATS